MARSGRLKSSTGFEAWHNSFIKHNPKTHAKLLMQWQAAVRPNAVKDVQLVPKAIEDWEMDIANLQRNFDEKLTDKMKVAGQDHVDCR